LQVRFTVPPRAPTLQAPEQVMSQDPPEQVTLDPAPTVWVHLVPEQLTLQLAPQEPVQVASPAQSKLQLEVEASQASKAQLCPVGHAQLFPLQYEPQAERRERRRVATRAMSFTGGDPFFEEERLRWASTATPAVTSRRVLRLVAGRRP